MDWKTRVEDRAPRNSTVRYAYLKLRRVAIRVDERAESIVPSPPFGKVSGWANLVRTEIQTRTERHAHRRVLKTINAIPTKNASAKRASLDRLTARYMTSIVLHCGISVRSFSKHITTTYSIIVLLYLNGLKTRNRRNVRRIENRKKVVYNKCQ